MTYIFIRQYFFCNGNYTFWLRGSTYCAVTFVLMYILARLYVQRQRENFKLRRQTK